MVQTKSKSRTSPAVVESSDSIALTVPRIVAVARRVMEESGVASVTMRRVASELGVTAMALYNHVADKQTLLALVADSVISAVPDFARDSQPWHERLREEFLAVHAEIDRYPGLGLYITGARSFYPSGLRKFHQTMKILQGAGFDEDEALQAIYLLLAYQGGYFLLNQAAAGPAAAGAPASGLDTGRTKGDVLVHHDFRRGLETVIAGLRVNLAEKQQG